MENGLLRPSSQEHRHPKSQTCDIHHRSILEDRRLQASIEPTATVRTIIQTNLPIAKTTTAQTMIDLCHAAIVVRQHPEGVRHREKCTILLNERNLATEAFVLGIAEASLTGQLPQAQADTIQTTKLEKKLEAALARLERCEEDNKVMSQHFTALQDSHSQQVSGLHNEIQKSHRLMDERLQQRDKDLQRLEKKNSELAMRLEEAERAKTKLETTTDGLTRTLGDLEDNVAKDSVDSQDQMEKVLREVADLCSKMETALGVTVNTAQQPTAMLTTIDRIQKDISALQEEQEISARVFESFQDAILGQTAQVVNDKKEVWDRVLESAFADMYDDFDYVRMEAKEAFEHAVQYRDSLLKDVRHITDFLEKQDQLNKSFASSRDLEDIRSSADASMESVNLALERTHSELANMEKLLARNKADSMAIVGPQTVFDPHSLPSPPIGQTPVLLSHGFRLSVTESAIVPVVPSDVRSPDPIGELDDDSTALRELRNQLNAADRRSKTLVSQVNGLKQFYDSMGKGMTSFSMKVAHDMESIQDAIHKTNILLSKAWDSICAEHNERTNLGALVNRFIQYDQNKESITRTFFANIQTAQTNLTHKHEAAQHDMLQIVQSHRQAAEEAETNKLMLNNLARCFGDFNTRLNGLVGSSGSTVSDITRLEKRGQTVVRSLERSVRRVSTTLREVRHQVGELQRASETQKVLIGDMDQSIQTAQKEAGVKQAGYDAAIEDQKRKALIQAERLKKLENETHKATEERAVSSKRPSSLSSPFPPAKREKRLSQKLVRIDDKVPTGNSGSRSNTSTPRKPHPPPGRRDSSPEL